jgi:integrase
MRHKQPTGQRIETKKAFYLRHYVTTPEGRRKVSVKLADKSDRYRSWADVEPLVTRALATASNSAAPSGNMLLADFVEQHYLPWCEKNKAASTVCGYKHVWRAQWQPRLGHLPLTAVSTAQVTNALTELAGTLGRAALSHVKWFLSGVYQDAKSQGIVPHNPVIDAKWRVKTKRPAKQRVYTLPEVLRMLDILAPIDLRAACTLALAYFAALRPCEIRGLTWADITEDRLYVRRSIWHRSVGDTKTESSVRSMLVIEPLRGLLARLRASQWGPKAPSDPIIQNQNRVPLSLDSINERIIRPTMKAAGINWRGYYAARRGFASLVTHSTKDALNATGILGHSTPITTLSHYTRAQADSMDAAMETIEQLATKKEVVQ